MSDRSSSLRKMVVETDNVKSITLIFGITKMAFGQKNGYMKGLVDQQKVE